MIISDLHLGEDIKPASSKMGFLRHVVLLERALEAFLNHHAATRLDDRPWRLIVNGDMVDFLSICLLPGAHDDASDAGERVAPEDHVYGLGTRPQAARAKMRRVLERHPGVFGALARFLGAGNDLQIVAGNHDVEFHWPIVQETFKQGIGARWTAEPAAAEPGARAAGDIEAAITFHPWFYFQENVVWVEHGHQYDDYCSFDYVLDPVAPQGDQIVMNVGAAGMRYVSNQFEAGHAGDADDWTAWEYVRWSFAKGARGLWRIAKGYFHMVVGMLTMWRIFMRQPEAVEARRLTHRERLRDLAAQVKLSEETLLAVENLRRRPIVTNLLAVVMAVMLDRLLVVIAATLLVLTSVLALPWLWAGAAVASVLALAFGANLVLSRRRDVDTTAKMRAVPEQIRRHVRAPFVVFGHSHKPVALELEGGGWYFNTGAWVATEKLGLPRAFTHVLIRHSAQGPLAALRQWRDGGSHEFTPPVLYPPPCRSPRT